MTGLQNQVEKVTEHYSRTVGYRADGGAGSEQRQEIERGALRSSHMCEHGPARLARSRALAKEGQWRSVQRRSNPTFYTDWRKPVNAPIFRMYRLHTLLQPLIAMREREIELPNRPKWFSTLRTRARARVRASNRSLRLFVTGDLFEISLPFEDTC